WNGVPFCILQLDIHREITHSCCSLADTLRERECNTGAGGSIGSTGISTILIILCVAPNYKLFQEYNIDIELKAANQNRF
ncbi:31555_t:CDS:2, partial [Gigaspora margarita]